MQQQWFEKPWFEKLERYLLVPACVLGVLGYFVSYLMQGHILAIIALGVLLVIGLGALFVFAAYANFIWHGPPKRKGRGR